MIHALQSIGWAAVWAVTIFSGCTTAKVIIQDDDLTTEQVVNTVVFPILAAILIVFWFN